MSIHVYKKKGNEIFTCSTSRYSLFKPFTLTTEYNTTDLLLSRPTVTAWHYNYLNQQTSDYMYLNQWATSARLMQSNFYLLFGRSGYDIFSHQMLNALPADWHYNVLARHLWDNSVFPISPMACICSMVFGSRRSQRKPTHTACNCKLFTESTRTVLPSYPRLFCCEMTEMMYYMSSYTWDPFQL